MPVSDSGAAPCVAFDVASTVRLPSGHAAASEWAAGTAVPGEYSPVIRATIALYALTTAAVVILHALVTLATADERGR